MLKFGWDSIRLKFICAVEASEFWPLFINTPWSLTKLIPPPMCIAPKWEELIACCCYLTGELVCEECKIILPILLFVLASNICSPALLIVEVGPFKLFCCWTWVALLSTMSTSPYFSSKNDLTGWLLLLDVLKLY